MSFLDPIDIANRALQIIGATRITSFTDNSKAASETAFVWDKLRKAELRRSVWCFATRRAVLRAQTATTRRMIPPPWTQGTVYSLGRVVRDTTPSADYWVCMVANTADTSVNLPGTFVQGQPQYWQQFFGPQHGDIWSATASYFAGEVVYHAGTPNDWYLSLANNNLNNTVSTSAFWVPLVATDLPFNPLVAAGTGVTISGLARNIYPLPHGYLRVTYPDPKTASTATNVISGGLQFNDLQFEGGYIVSANSGPLLLRFVADVSDVTAFDSLFAEALANRIAYEICETMTQSATKLQAIGAAYQKFMEEARLINWIESASDEPQEQTYEATQGPANTNEMSRTASAPQQGGR